jgi:predicted TIM-barrel fold metal-dependent hydrolase
MSKRVHLCNFVLLLIVSSLMFGQTPAPAPPRLIDAHLHHNGDPAFLEKVVAKLGSVDGLAFILTSPKDLESVQAYVAHYPNRLVGFGDIKLDDPQALELVDRFHAAGFRGLGEFSGPLKNYDDKSYWEIYERAEKYGILW